MKYIAIFDLPENYVMGCAVGMICPNDGKIRTDREFEKLYAQIEPLAEQQEEMFSKFNVFQRIIQDLGISNTYDMPSFWCNGGKDYKVIPTKYNKGYMQALNDIDKEIRLKFGFAERNDVNVPMFFSGSEEEK